VFLRIIYSRNAPDILARQYPVRAKFLIFGPPFSEIKMATVSSTKWYTFLLLPLSALYGLVTGIRNLLFDLGILPSVEFRIPVISVGNITVGGTGKTPHVEYLLGILKEQYKTASLSRGYLRKTNGFLIAGKSSTVDEIGDEARQVALKFPEVTVAVDANRVRGIDQLMNLDPELGVVVLDDAYQYRFGKPGLSILLVDYNRPLESDSLLPAGRLRESPTSRARADIIIVTKCPDRLKPVEQRDIIRTMDLRMHQHIYFTTIEYGELIPVFRQEKQRSLAEFKEARKDVLMVTGIANPRPLKKYARNISPRVESIAFPDHHPYTAGDMNDIREKWLELGDPDALVLTTEKDAMRMQMLDPADDLKKALYYVEIKIRFLNNEEQAFNQLILNYVRNNKRDSILYKGTDRKGA